MINSQIVRLISELPHQERKKFLDFVASPYFNKHKDSLRLLKYILEGLNKKTEKQLDRSVLLKKMYGNEQVSFQKLKDLSSKLMRLLEKFMGQREFDNDPYLSDIFICKYAYGMQLNQLLEKHIKKTRTKLESKPTRGIEYYQTDESLCTLEHHLYSRNRQYTLSIEKGIEAFKLKKTIFQHNALRLGLFINKRNLYQKEFASNPHQELIQDTIKEIQENGGNELLKINKNLLLSFSGGIVNDITIRKYSNELNSNILLFSSKEAFFMYSIIFDYYSQKINTGEIKYMENIFDVIKTMVEKNCHFDYVNFIPSEFFYNAVMIACSSNEISWAENFVDENWKYCKDPNIYKYCLSIIYFTRKEFKKTLELLLEINHKPHDLMVYPYKITLITTYIELKEWRLSEYALESFRIFCRRRKDLNSMAKQGFLNFIKLLKRIISIHQMYDTKTKETHIEKLALDIKQCDNILAKDELILQFNNLKKLI